MPRPTFETTIYQNAEVSATQVLVKLARPVQPASPTPCRRSATSMARSGPTACDPDPDTQAPIDNVLNAISKLPGVSLAEPDYVLRAFDESGLGGGGPDSGVTGPGGFDTGTELTGLDVSNDPSVTSGTTWGMYGDTTSRVNAFGSQAGEAWTAGYTGSTKVGVGLVDTGVDYTHPDLYLNVWLNQAEIPLSFKASLTDVDATAASPSAI